MACSGDNPEKENQREEENQQAEKVSWFAYHANLQPHTESSQARVTQTSLLPLLFHDQAHSTAMIHHSMDVVKKAVEILNPGQVPVIAMNQPLYVLAKQIQWNWNTREMDST